MILVSILSNKFIYILDPDLAVGNMMNMKLFNDKKLIEKNIDISSFILPLVYKGNLNQIIWVKPKWSNQIDCKCLSYD